MSEVEERARRKHEHIAAVQSIPDQHGTGFEDVVLLAESASEVNVDQVSLETELFGQRLKAPIVINAMTGGTEEAQVINQRLARFARRHGIAMAVGSETAALKSPDAEPSYVIVRQSYPDGLLIANVGMGASPDVAQRAVDLIDANVLQIHWNTAQELFMAEGDRDFQGMLAKLQEVCQRSTVPVVAKEVGQGMTGRSAKRFVDHGAKGIDIGGMGGTNFIAIESWRRGQTLDDEWRRWGVPTAASLAEVSHDIPSNIPIIASGGIRTAHDIAKSLIMGAQAVGVAGPLMRLASQADSDEPLDEWMSQIQWSLTTIMVLLGCTTIAQLKSRPALIMGQTAQWLSTRGYQSYVEQLARR